MANFSTDENLLTYEPELFRDTASPNQRLTENSDGVIRHSGSAVILSAATIDLVDSGVTSGHVVYLSKETSNTTLYDVCWPVKHVETSTTVHLEATPASCPTASSITYRVSTFDAQHENAHFTLCQKWGIDDEDNMTTNDEADLYNRRQLRASSVYWGLSNIYAGQSMSENDIYAAKAERYGIMYDNSIVATKLQWDTNDDDTVDRTDHGGSVKLIVGDSGDAWPTADFDRVEEGDETNG